MLILKFLQRNLPELVLITLLIILVCAKVYIFYFSLILQLSKKTNINKNSVVRLIVEEKYEK